MPLEIIRKDITKVHTHAIVIPTNSSLCSTIHEEADPELLNVSQALGDCSVGHVKITSGYKLPAKYIIHITAPVWKDGKSHEEDQLVEYYKNALTLAKEYKLESIAIVLITSEEFGYPKDKVLSIPISTIEQFLLNNEMTVKLVVCDRSSFPFSEKLLTSITQYIDEKYIEEYPADYKHVLYDEEEINADVFKAPNIVYDYKINRKLEKLVINLDQTFTQMLLRLIDEKGMTDVETYKKANIDRKHFSKIKNNIHYKPSKTTAIAFAIALKLNLDETKDLLLKAGFALSHSSKFDIIIEYFIENSNYNIYEINEVLFAFEESLLG